jgi:hypothetical protein
MEELALPMWELVTLMEKLREELWDWLLVERSPSPSD